MLDDASGITSCLKDRKLMCDVYYLARKAKFWVNRSKEMLEFIKQCLVRGSFKDRFLEINTGVESKG